ncbi:CBL-interacting protein kinase 23-like [Carica papaya]|uniref:CBL-interacting protein kinase 23-like n=1 Tax=Carica papaya TaxID=3649 RepID=UPI000B8CC8CE|nr:CBL-interacting protein kinase 23-like [Carica papaya]
MSSRASSGSRTRVGKYELGRTLGEGTFAKVKFARNVDTGENVAIKILDKEKILKHKMIGQIKREISTMKLIRHPNVIRMYEVMASKTKIYIVLEFVTGGELFDKIASKGRLKEDEARKYFQQLINADVQKSYQGDVGANKLIVELVVVPAWNLPYTYEQGLKSINEDSKWGLEKN